MHFRISIYILVLILLVLFPSELSCQTRQITGTVISSEDNLPIPGATIIVPGANIGSITNLDGFFAIDIPEETDTLEIRSVGMQSVKVSVTGIDKIDVTLDPEVYSMDEVVVTALGISREAKSLGYSVTALGSDEISKSNDRSVLNALQGKVAGVNITSASGAPGSSTRILVRGVSSLTGSNQPLIIINGVPVSNSHSGSSSINGGTDFGNKLNDINPDDIESLSILKGASGTVLYGSRAANGVIIITTKSGQKAKKTQVSLNSSYGLEKPLKLVQYQNEYGQGLYGNSVLYENTSWGPKFDNKFHPWGNNVDNSLRVKSYSALPDNVSEFFETGTILSNSLSIDGGSEQTTYYFSYSNVFADGIFPTDADSYDKHSISLNASHQLSEKLKTSTFINYIRKKNSFVPTGQGGQSVYDQVMQTPRDISLRELEDLDEKWNSVDNYYSLYTVNPYHNLKNNFSENTEDRILGSLEFNYNMLKNLNILWRLGGDVSNEQRKSFREKIEPEGNNEFSSVGDPGVVSKGSITQSIINSDLIFTYLYEMKNWSFNLLAASSINQRSASALSASVQNLTINGFPNLSNSSERATAGEGSSMRRSIGVYGTADIAFRNLLFLSLNARNEWSSTLPSDNNSFFYPGASLGLIFSELFPVIKSFLPYGKIRVSWARVGNDAPPYMVNSVFQKGFHSDGFGYLTYPLSSGVNSYDVGDLIANENLKSELTEEYEAGADLRFFNNRFSIDFAYYHKSTTDLIWPSPLPYSSGYRYQTQNLGKIINYGIEGLVSIIPVKKRKFEWEFTVNFTRNYNRLDYLNNQLEKAELNSLSVDGGQQISWSAIPGMPIGVFEVRTPKYTADGKMVVDNQGLLIADKELSIIGDSQYKYYGGISNRFTYNNMSFSFMIDFRKGGLMYSRTKDITMFAGTVPLTLYNDREPFIIPNSVVEVGTDDNGDPVYVENTKPIDRVHLVDYWGNGGSELDAASLIDKSFIKLREVVLSYSIPVQKFKKSPFENISISIVGKNLLLFTPHDQTYIDPELTTFGNDLTADFGEYGAQPSTRSVSFNLRVLF